MLMALGCPKQELWMNQHKDKIQAVMIGLGGRFLSLQKVIKERLIGYVIYDVSGYIV